MESLVWLFKLVSFFFNDTPTTEIYTLSLHDALPIFQHLAVHQAGQHEGARRGAGVQQDGGDQPRADQHAGPVPDLQGDRKSTRLNSSHVEISYAVFCLKKKNIKKLNKF